MTLVQRQIAHTRRKIMLMNYMLSEGEIFVQADSFRSPECQHFLFHFGRDENHNVIDPEKVVTKCDGYNIRSRHQDKLADDFLFFSESGEYLRQMPVDKIRKYHDYWETVGGRPLISWDPVHFES